MNTIFVHQAPEGDFVAVNSQMPEWETHFLHLIEAKKSITYKVNEVAELPAAIETALNRQGYHRFILRNSNWQTFLVPLLMSIG